MSIVFGTLTASTISDATARLAALRAAAVEECTLMMTLVKRLEVVLVLDKNAPARGPDLFAAVADRLWTHSTDLLGGTRERELKLIAEGTDGISEVLQILQQAQCSFDETEVSFSLDLCGRLMEARGIRLSLENSGIPAVQYSVLESLSVALAAAYSRRADISPTNRGDNANIPWRRIAATPRPRTWRRAATTPRPRTFPGETSRSDAAAATWIVRGVGSRRRPRRGRSVETGARALGIRTSR